MKHFPLSYKELKLITEEYPTPFYLYDEKAIRENVRRLQKAFSWNTGFREYFAVKSTPNPSIMQIFKEENCGVDCASETELILADSCNFHGDEIMFTSNNTSTNEFIKAHKLNAIINLDDISHIEYLEKCAGIPELTCFRLNPGGTIRYKDKTLLNYEDYKFGFTMEQFIEGVTLLKTKGLSRIGLHSQFGCHRTEADHFGENARCLFEKVVEIYNRTGVRCEFINLAGGLGIPYQEGESSADIDAVSKAIRSAYEDILGAAGLDTIPLYIEFGIYMTGPYGYFVSSVLHVKESYKTFLGLDASTNTFMSPSRYTDHHHITVAGKENEPCEFAYEITGSTCENRDRFATGRLLPHMEQGDILIFHDAGAYTYAHANNFNGRLRAAELLLCQDGSIRQIRRAEEPKDYFSTLVFPIRYE
ncbi:MAG TPA: diaminopimelate decarboxylase [Lachnospiraceae bacterium]|nr:diaminopimelate decarboxylase [Lachnospiraceae bacterium]